MRRLRRGSQTRFEKEGCSHVDGHRRGGSGRRGGRFLCVGAAKAIAARSRACFPLPGVHPANPFPANPNRRQGALSALLEAGDAARRARQG